MFSKNIFSQRLAYLRKKNSISQDTLAKKVNISRFAIGKMEKGERAASIEVLYQLADHFDVSLDYLVGRSDDPKRY
mgnify:CR=1 FL=1